MIWECLWRLQWNQQNHGKDCSNNQNSMVNTADLTLKQKFDCEISGITRWDLKIGDNSLVESFIEISVINWWWKNHQPSTHESLRLFRVCIVSWKDPESNEVWKRMIKWITSSQNCRDFNGISGEPTQFEWNIFPRFDTLQLYGKMTDLLSRLGEHQKISQKEFC